MKTQLFYVIFCFLVCGGHNLSQAQYVEKKQQREKTTDTPKPQKDMNNLNEASNDAQWRDNLRVGGNFWVDFFNGTFINISPIVSYRVSDRFIPAVGVIYMYRSFRNTNINTSVLGGRLMGNYFVSSQIAITAEAETMYTSYFDNATQRKLQTGLFNPLAGITYRMGLGRGGFVGSILYNFNYQPNITPYPSPWVFRVGFGL